LIRFSVANPERYFVKIHYISAKNSIFKKVALGSFEHAKKKEKNQHYMIFFLDFLFTYLSHF